VEPRDELAPERHQSEEPTLRFDFDPRFVHHAGQHELLKLGAQLMIGRDLIADLSNALLRRLNTEETSLGISAQPLDRRHRHECASHRQVVREVPHRLEVLEPELPEIRPQGYADRQRSSDDSDDEIGYE